MNFCPVRVAVGEGGLKELKQSSGQKMDWFEQSLNRPGIDSGKLTQPKTKQEEDHEIKHKG